MAGDTVTVRVPAEAGHLAVLRTVVGGVAARDSFTLDQVDDLRMAVEESAVQLLRRIGDGPLQLDVRTTSKGIEVRLHADVATSGAVIDESSLSWAILEALADDLRVEVEGRHASVVLTKDRIILAAAQDRT